MRKTISFSFKSWHSRGTINLGADMTSTWGTLQGKSLSITDVVIFGYDLRGNTVSSCSIGFKFRGMSKYNRVDIRSRQVSGMMKYSSTSTAFEFTGRCTSSVKDLEDFIAFVIALQDKSPRKSFGDRKLSGKQHIKNFYGSQSTTHGLRG